MDSGEGAWPAMISQTPTTTSMAAGTSRINQKNTSFMPGE